MSYLPGTQIDLTYLNKGGGLRPSKKSSTKSFDVGTSFTFKTIGDRLKAYRRVPVAFI
jgi:hypothetical protein